MDTGVLSSLPWGDLMLIVCVQLQFLRFPFLPNLDGELMLGGLLDVLKQVPFPLPDSLHRSRQLLQVSSLPVAYVGNAGQSWPAAYMKGLLLMLRRHQQGRPTHFLPRSRLVLLASRPPTGVPRSPNSRKPLPSEGGDTVDPCQVGTAALEIHRKWGPTRRTPFADVQAISQEPRAPTECLFLLRGAMLDELSQQWPSP